MICDNCGMEREFIENGICIVCKRADNGAKIVKNTDYNIKDLKKVDSKTGKIDENQHLRI